MDIMPVCLPHRVALSVFVQSDLNSLRKGASVILAGRGALIGMSPVSDAPGRFVVLVGPDGVGKTSVARALLAHHRGPAAYFHFLPPLDGRWPAAPGPTSVPPPKARGGGSVILGWIRLAQKRCQMLGRLPEIRSASPQTGPPDRWRSLDVWVYRPTRCHEISRTRSVGARGSAFVAASTPDCEPGRPAACHQGA